MRTCSILVTAALAVSAASFTYAEENPAVAATTPAPAIDEAKLQAEVSYLVGLQMSGTVAQYQLDATAVARAIADAAAGKPPEVDPARGQQLFPAWEQVMRSRKAADGAKRGESNSKWLADHAKQPGVQVTASGIHYEVLTSAGAAAKPKATDTVRVHYTGKLVDGTVFDSSEQRGEPAEFPLNGVIPGWTEGLQLMQVGERFRFAIPPELAYGEGGQGPIGPNSILIFEVQLIAIL